MKDSYALSKNEEVINCENFVKLLRVELTISFFLRKIFPRYAKS